jgi:multiple sugar transport system substrate-binding protein
MPTLSRPAALLAALALALAAGTARADTKLRVFVGGQQRPDVMRPLLDRFQQQNPGTTVGLEVGGATSEAQQQYLTTVLSSADSSIDVMLIDVVRPAEYAAAGWAEPLDSYLGTDKDALLARYLPAYRDADVVEGHVMALPAFADAMFLYYRKDLLEKYKLQPPQIWDDVVKGATQILTGEKDDNLQGVSFQGRPIEGTVCTFLVPYWQAGGSLVDENGRFHFDRKAAGRSFGLWTHMVSEGQAIRSTAEVGTDDTRRDFQAGNAAFAVLWAYGWNHFQNDPDSKVAGKVGVMQLPTFRGAQQATCLGGWQWAVSAYSKNKAAAAKLVQYLAGPEAEKTLALKASNLPAMPELYDDPDVQKANPWFADAKAALANARARPQSPRYSEVSDLIRGDFSATLAGITTVSDAMADMESRLRRALR